MEIKYSRKEFEGYTHRFIVQFDTGGPHYNNLNIYSNSDDIRCLEAFIKEHKSERVKSFEIIHCASIQQDEASARLIDEIINGN